MVPFLALRPLPRLMVFLVLCWCPFLKAGSQPCSQTFLENLIRSYSIPNGQPPTPVVVLSESGEAPAFNLPYSTVKTVKELARVLEQQRPMAVLVSGSLPSELSPLLQNHKQRIPFLLIGLRAPLGLRDAIASLRLGIHQIVLPGEDIQKAVLAAESYFHPPKSATRIATEFAQRGIINVSPVMVSVYREVEHAAHTDATVLLTGNTGVGKAALATAIHTLSPQAAGPLVVYNCANLNLDSSLAESSLFGHAKGAFTGAAYANPGLFREAENGTLILDEIQTLSPKLQAKLLGVLENGKARPVGGGEYLSKVRVIAVSNLSLPRLAEQGKFREDLYYRLNRISIFVPPLAERREDIVPQALYFLQEAQGSIPEVEGLSPQAKEALQLLPWPGNSRQLRDSVRESLRVRKLRGKTLGLEDLPMSLLQELIPDAAEQKAPWVAASFPLPPGAPLSVLRRLERDHIRRSLAHNKGNMNETARQLGIAAGTLKRKAGY